MIAYAQFFTPHPALWICVVASPDWIQRYGYFRRPPQFEFETREAAEAERDFHIREGCYACVLPPLRLGEGREDPTPLNVAAAMRDPNLKRQIDEQMQVIGDLREDEATEDC
jgi:hypothetical protein